MLKYQLCHAPCLDPGGGWYSTTFFYPQVNLQLGWLLSGKLNQAIILKTTKLKDFSTNIMNKRNEIFWASQKYLLISGTQHNMWYIKKNFNYIRRFSNWKSSLWATQWYDVFSTQPELSDMGYRAPQLSWSTMLFRRHKDSSKTVWSWTHVSKTRFLGDMSCLKDREFKQQ